MSAGLIKRACPLCGSTEADPLVRLELGNFDNEAPRTIEAFSCRLCGLVYNQADPEELARYYRDTKRFSSERGWLGGGRSWKNFKTGARPISWTRSANFCLIAA